MELLLHIALVHSTAAHLLCVNVGAAGPVLCLWLAWRQRRGDALARDVGLWLLGRSIAAILIGGLLGGLSLGLLWLLPAGQYFRAAGQLPGERYWFTAAELLVSLGCYGAWLWLWRAGRLAALQWLAALLGITNLLYHFPTLFAVLTTLSVRPPLAGETHFIDMLADQAVLARVLHFLLAALATGGVMLMGYALREMRGQPDDASQQRAARAASWGGRVALAATLLQWLSGVYLLMALPGATRNLLLGGHMAATLLFAGAMLATVLLMHRLASVALGETARRELIGSMAMLVLVVVLMVAAWHTTRMTIFRRLEASELGPRAEAYATIVPQYKPQTSRQQDSP